MASSRTIMSRGGPSNLKSSEIIPYDHPDQHSGKEPLGPCCHQPQHQNTAIYDSFDLDTTRNTLRPAHPEMHRHLLTWLTREHQVRKTPFNAQDWTTINPFSRGQQTPQQGTRGFPGVDCGVFVLAFAMYLSTNRPFEFCQNDMPTLRNWVV
jgi:hypothetical protein